MGKFKGKKLLAQTAQFITLQLFISCISLPILGYWGLPQPILSPLGNLFFAPFLTGFLLFSTLVFFAYILALPTGLLLFILEKITAAWTFVLTLNIATPFVSCVRPPLFILIGLPLAACALVARQKNSKPHKTIIFLALLLVSTHTILYFFYTTHTFVYSLPYNNGAVTIIRSKKETLVIDPGVIGKRVSACSWCEYTLIPEIIKRTGKNSIDHFICLRPGKVLFDALEKVAQKTTISRLHIPWWTNHVPAGCWRSYCILKKTILERKGTIVRIGNNECNVGKSGLYIKSTQAIRSYYDAQFHQFYIEGIIDNNRISIYAP